MLKRKIIAIALTAALVSSFALPVAAAETSSASVPAQEEVQELPDSYLYYGVVKEIRTDENGNITQILMDSERYGELVALISEETVWVDSGHQRASDPSDLKVGEGIYVFHSPIQTMSLPPQSPAFAVVRDIPMDAGCAQYHEIEEVTEREDGKLQITTSNGGLYLIADEDTIVVSYDGEEDASLDDLKPGDHAMFWYGMVATSYPGQAYPNTVMILPEHDDDTLTGEEAASMLAELSDEGVETLAEAAQTAFESDDAVTLEEFVTALWEQAGSPVVENYWGLIRFEDAGKISSDARDAMRWADKNGLLSGIEGDKLNSAENISETLAKEILAQYQELDG